MSCIGNVYSMGMGVVMFKDWGVWAKVMKHCIKRGGSLSKY